MDYESIPLNDFITDYLKDHPLVVAIEQREFVWDSANVIQLLDSICRSIPLGTIILGSGPGLDADGRTLQPSSNSTIYDGQQRLMSLKKAFVDRELYLPKDKFLTGKRCRVWVDIHNFKTAIQSAGRDKNSFMRFKHKGKTGCYPFEIVPDDATIGLDPNETQTSLQNFVKRTRTFRNASNEWATLVDVLDPTTTGPDGIAEVRDFLRTKMSQYRICVCRIGTDTDVDNLFLRINSAGKEVTDDEQYFARLKQHWHDAEHGLKGLHGDGTPFGLLDAVRLMVYMAHNIDNGAGTTKKKAKGVFSRLRLRDFNERIVDAIQGLLGGEKKRTIEKATKTCTVELAAAGLQYGIHLVNKKLVAMAMASAMGDLVCGNSGQLPDAGAVSWKQLARYLFVLDQSGVLSSLRKDAEFRKTFEELWSRPFPDELHQRDAFDERCRKDKLDTLLWLAIFQQVPLGWNRGTFDIDHIIPHSWVKSRWGITSELRTAVDSIGNMWLVDRRTNREWQNVRTPAGKYDAVVQSPDILVGCKLEDVSLAKGTFEGLASAASLKTEQESVLRAIKSRADEVRRRVRKLLMI